MKKIIYVIIFMLLINISCKKQNEPVKVNFILRISPNYLKRVDFSIININYLLQSKDSEIDTDDDWDVPSTSYPDEYIQELNSNANESIIATTDIVPGELSRILIGLSECSVWEAVNYPPYSISYDLTVPYIYVDMLNFKANVNIEPDQENNIYIEFDARESIYIEDGNYYMKPQLRAYTDKTTGCVQGYISPVEAQPYIYVISGNDTIHTISEKTDGYFKVRGIPGGSYELKFEPLKGYSVKSSEITISNGKTLNLGEIAF
ncbi:MAG: hypothetical protein JXB17_04745 [Bacteroidales bacterium]|nr:hypothetical protein [Bacteroidales bacterium]